MKKIAHRDKKIGGYHYRGFYFKRPEGCTYWNIYDTTNGNINFGHPICHPISFKNCKETIDYIKDEKEDNRDEEN